MNLQQYDSYVTHYFISLITDNRKKPLHILKELSLIFENKIDQSPSAPYKQQRKQFNTD
jgi:hypothetical protein